MKRSALTFLAIVCFTDLAEARAVDHSVTTGPRSTLDMTCMEAQKYIARNDGAVLKTGNTWGNYQTSYCNSGSYPGSAPAYVRSKDQSACFVGLSCNCHTGFCPQIWWQGIE
jgi:hypothetical protein